MPPNQPSPHNPDPHTSRPIPVWVTSVPDGDSLWIVRDPNSVDSEIPVRLFGIDAPEKDQDYGPEAQQALWRLVWRTRSLRMEVIDVDHYHRLVVLLYHHSAGRRRSINRILIEQGHARWYSRFGGEEFGFASAEDQARSNRRGLWRNRHQVAPWDHRAAQRRRQSQHRGCFALMAAASLLLLLLIALLLGLP